MYSLATVAMNQAGAATSLLDHPQLTIAAIYICSLACVAPVIFSNPSITQSKNLLLLACLLSLVIPEYLVLSSFLEFPSSPFFHAFFILSMVAFFTPTNLGLIAIIMLRGSAVRIRRWAISTAIFIVLTWLGQSLWIFGLS